MTSNRRRLPALMTAAAAFILAVAGDARANDRDLTVEIVAKAGRAPGVAMMPTQPAVLSIGDRFGVRVSAAASGYGHLYALSASGKVQLWFENLPVRAHQRVSYPSNGLEMRATPPAGDDTVIFVFTRNRFDGFLGRTATRSPHALQFSHAAFRHALDGKIAMLQRRDWASVRTIVRVQQ
jgi:hypothetical protein